MISCNRNIDAYARFRDALVVDEEPPRGPLGGVLAGLMRADTDFVFVCPGDAPFLSRTLVTRLAVALDDEHADVALPHDGTRRQHLFVPDASFAGAGATRVISTRGSRSVHAFIDQQHAAIVDAALRWPCVRQRQFGGGSRGGCRAENELKLICIRIRRLDQPLACGRRRDDFLVSCERSTRRTISGLRLACSDARSDGIYIACGLRRVGREYHNRLAAHREGDFVGIGCRGTADDESTQRISGCAYSLGQDGRAISCSDRVSANHRAPQGPPARRRRSPGDSGTESRRATRAGRPAQRGRPGVRVGREVRANADPIRD